MNNKLVLGLIAVLVIIVGYLLFGTAGTKQQSVTPQPAPTTQVSPTQNPVQPAGVTVEVTDNGYSPQTVTIKKGTKVVWTNKTDRTVTVNSDPHPIHVKYPALNLGSFDTNEVVQLVFGKEGTYTYHNHLNASMTGKIIVE